MILGADAHPAHHAVEREQVGGHRADRHAVDRRVDQQHVGLRLEGDRQRHAADVGDDAPAGVVDPRGADREQVHELSAHRCLTG
jgi:hypothetical protein